MSYSRSCSCTSPADISPNVSLLSFMSLKMAASCSFCTLWGREDTEEKGAPSPQWGDATRARAWGPALSAAAVSAFQDKKKIKPKRNPLKTHELVWENDLSWKVLKAGSTSWVFPEGLGRTQVTLWVPVPLFSLGPPFSVDLAPPGR